ncbi:MAG: hypothetical protein AAGC45_08870 [Bacteroidota bacterium]
MDNRKHVMIQRLVQQIEHQMGWGSGQNWSNKDFEALSEQIFERTKKKLSVTTLKRIWGRAEMVANPSSATLDILSEFIGRRSWREYTQSAKPEKSPSHSKSTKKRLRQAALVILTISVALLIRSYTTSSNQKSKETPSLDTSLFTFESKVVSSGLPNSVIFSYDASSADTTAEIQIQQDWDDRKRIRVSKEDSIATCIYYRPGFFKSKLVVNESVVREDDVFITSNGWLGTINKDSVPIYLGKDEIVKDNEIGIDVTTLSAYGIDPKTTGTTTSLYFIDDFTDMYTHEFNLALEIRNAMGNALGGCQEIEVYMLYDGGAIGIPLAKKGCISNLNLMAFDRYINGKKNDLSSFGVAFETFEKLSFGADHSALKIWVNDNLAYELPVVNPVRAIKGISVHFSGTGAIRNVILKNTKGVSYNFN